MVTLQLLDLPDELLIIILSGLPMSSILACKVSCRRLRAVIKGWEVFRWRMWSAKHGIQEVLPSGPPLPDFFTNAQRPFQGSPRDKWPELCSTANKCHFLLRSGYLIQMRRKENPGWSHMQLSLLRELRGFISNPVWTDVRLGDHLTMEGWALDLDQDLVAASLLSTEIPVGRLEIHLVHFATGKRHESANVPAVQLEFKGKYDRPFGTHIEIMGNYLVILLAHGTSRRKYQTLYLVDWIKGHVIYRQCCSANTYFPVLTSISESTFVLGLKSDWALALCRITKEGDALTFCTLSKLKLPDIWYNTRVQLKNFCRAPPGPDNPSAPECHSTAQFRNSPSDSILSFYVNASRGLGWKNTPITLFFYVHPSALRALAERAVTAQVSVMRGLCHRLTRCTSLSPKTLPITVPWKNWGPETTRWIKPDRETVFQSLSGTRCAISKWAPAKLEVQLLDFNVERVRVLENRADTVTKSTERVNSQAAISARRYFKQKIVSHLPYFKIRSEGRSGENSGQLLIDDQWVVQTQDNRKLQGPDFFSSHTIRMHSVEEGRRRKKRPAPVGTDS